MLMNTLWASPAELSVQEVCTSLGPRSNYKTVMTVLNRLVGKELLTRQLNGRAYRYRASLSREDFLRSLARDMVRGFVQSYGPGASLHVAEAAAAIAPNHTSPHPVYPDDQRHSHFSPLATIAALVATFQAILYLCSRKKNN
jgi:predicted transcriptional regulator